MNLPNSLSAFRLLLVPVFALIYFSTYNEYAVCIFLLASATDVLDGFIARRFGQITRLGRLLDPLADKLMTGCVLICMSIGGKVPIWVTLLFCMKEITMGIGALLQWRRIDDVPAAKFYGKASAVLFFIVLVSLMVFDIAEPYTTIMLSAAMILMFSAFGMYIRRYLQMKNK